MITSPCKYRNSSLDGVFELRYLEICRNVSKVLGRVRTYLKVIDSQNILSDPEGIDRLRAEVALLSVTCHVFSSGTWSTPCEIIPCPWNFVPCWVVLFYPHWKYFEIFFFSEWITCRFFVIKPLSQLSNQEASLSGHKDSKGLRWLRIK